MNSIHLKKYIVDVHAESASPNSKILQINKCLTYKSLLESYQEFLISLSSMLKFNGYNIITDEIIELDFHYLSATRMLSTGICLRCEIFICMHENPAGDSIENKDFKSRQYTWYLKQISIGEHHFEDYDDAFSFIQMDLLKYELSFFEIDSIRKHLVDVHIVSLVDGGSAPFYTCERDQDFNLIEYNDFVNRIMDVFWDNSYKLFDISSNENFDRFQGFRESNSNVMVEVVESKIIDDVASLSETEIQSLRTEFPMKNWVLRSIRIDDEIVVDWINQGCETAISILNSLFLQEM